MAQAGNGVNFPIPAVQGPLYLRPVGVDPAGVGDGRTTAVKLYAAEQDGAIVELAGLQVRGGTHSDLESARVLTLDKSLFLIPEAQALVSLPATHDRAIVYTVDIEQQLQRTHVPFLFVTSRPPHRVAAGGRLDYQMVVKSKRGGTVCSVSSGPHGMQVTPAGHVTWEIPTDAAGKTEHVIVTVTDSTGQQIIMRSPWMSSALAARVHNPHRRQKRHLRAPAHATPGRIPPDASKSRLASSVSTARWSWWRMRKVSSATFHCRGSAESTSGTSRNSSTPP